jgi:5-bromo-4-chloroindolyl phosphate hydrolysis protein
MMTDKSEQFISDKWQLSRADIDEVYEVKLTDRQWKLIVQYLDEYEDNSESHKELYEIMADLDGLEKFDKDYEKSWQEFHGNPYPFTKDGVNVEEDND